MKKRVFVLAFLILAGAAIAQSNSRGVYDTFEDDSPGSIPSGTWYAYGERELTGVTTGDPCENLTVYSFTDGNNMFGSRRSDCSDAGQFLLFEPQRAINFTLEAYGCNSGGGGSGVLSIDFFNSGGDRISRMRSQSINSPNCPADDDGGDMAISTSSLTNISAWTICGLFDAYSDLTIVFDWENQLFQSYDGATQIRSCAFDNPADGLSYIEFRDGGTQDRDHGIWWDDIFLSNVTDPGGPGQEPSEFDEGLTAFLSGVGFKTPESQFFFTLVFIGLAVVSVAVSIRFISPGRLKTHAVNGSAVLVGVFGVYQGWLDTWMWIVAFMCSLFAINGLREVENTYHEIVARARNGPGGLPFITRPGEPTPFESIDIESPGPEVRDIDSFISSSDDGGSEMGEDDA